MGKNMIQKAGKDFTDAEKHRIIRELISTGCTKASIWEKYTGKKEEHGQLLRWMQQLGYDTGIRTRKPTIVPSYSPMSKNTAQKLDDFESLLLKKRIAELEKQLKDAELRAIAFSTMVDIAEKEFNIPIRKKLATKP